MGHSFIVRQVPSTAAKTSWCRLTAQGSGSVRVFTHRRNWWDIITLKTVHMYNLLTSYAAFPGQQCIKCNDYKYCCWAGPDLPMVWIQSQLWQLTDNLPDDLPALLELPLPLEQGPTASNHTTTDEEEETGKISGLNEDLQRYQLSLIPSLTNPCTLGGAAHAEYQLILINISHITVGFNCCVSVDDKL